MGTHYNDLNEVVRSSTYNLCLDQNKKCIAICYLKIVILTFVKVTVYRIGVLRYTISLSCLQSADQEGETYIDRENLRQREIL